MNIIERAVELLASSPQARRKPAAANEETDNLGQDLIERAGGNIGGRGSSAADRQALAGGRTTPVLKVDRNRLRQLNMITPDGERTAIAESFRRVKRQVLASAAGAGGAPANLVLVTSAVAGEGKTFCAINLAISIALEMDRTVLLVDADVAKPNVLQTLGLAAGRGLMDALLDPQLDLADVLCKTDIDRLSLLPAGTPHKHATELLASDAMRGLLHEMAERYRDRVIIFDSPPLLAASEAGVLAGQMGQVVVVVEAEKTAEATIREALERIDQSRIAGLLLNKAETPSPGYGYYGYG